MDKKQKYGLILLLLLLLLGFIYFLIYRPDKTDEEQSSTNITYHSYHFDDVSIFFPEQKGDQLVRYTGINIAYNEANEQALWVCYLITKNYLENPVCERKNRFKSDPNIHSKSANPKDYYKSGYDRGHLAPAADMLWSEEAMRESFYMSNMSPQKPGFNRGVWKRLESAVRKTALIEDSLIIITGALFYDSLGSIGENNVTIPGYYYKAIIDISAPHLGAVAFVIPNRNTKLPLDKFAISLDSLESLSKINLLEPLPDDLENQLENTVDNNLLEELMR
jgi:endonuclease G